MELKRLRCPIVLIVHHCVSDLAMNQNIALATQQLQSNQPYVMTLESTEVVFLGQVELLT